VSPDIEAHPRSLAGATVLQVAPALRDNPSGNAALDIAAYEALGACARRFAEFMFLPQSVAEAIRGVYTSLLAHGT
jgi:hypothetical protein